MLYGLLVLKMSKGMLRCLLMRDQHDRDDLPHLPK